PSGILRKLQRSGVAQQADAFDLGIRALARRQRGDNGLLAGPGQGDGVEVVPLDGEAVAAAARAFAVPDPLVRAVDRLAVDFEPAADPQEGLLLFLRDG